MAARALGNNGTVVCGSAPDLPPAPQGADGAFMLDMMHFLSDPQLTLTLQRLRARLAPGALLTIRAIMVPQRRMAWYWWVDGIKNKLNGFETHWRTAEKIESLLTQCGFQVSHRATSGAKGDMLWVSAVKTPDAD